MLSVSISASRPLRHIGQNAIDTAASRLYPKASNATRNRQVYTPVSAIMQHAARKGWCPRPVFSRPKMPKVAIRWLRPDEAERLIGACSLHLRPLVIFLLYTGARAGEALWLDWSNVDLQRRHVTFPRTKNGDARGVPLHSRVAAALAALSGREGPVFRAPSGVPYTRPAAGDGHVRRFSYQDGFRWRVPPGGDLRLHAPWLSAYLGHLALPRKPQPDRPPKPWRLENTLDGHAICSH